MYPFDLAIETTTEDQHCKGPLPVCEVAPLDYHLCSGLISSISRDSKMKIARPWKRLKRDVSGAQDLRIVEAIEYQVYSCACLRAARVSPERAVREGEGGRSQNVPRDEG